jgi:hypothetical protein
VSAFRIGDLLGLLYQIGIALKGIENSPKG